MTTNNNTENRVTDKATKRATDTLTSIERLHKQLTIMDYLGALGRLPENRSIDSNRLDFLINEMESRGFYITEYPTYNNDNAKGEIFLRSLIEVSEGIGVISDEPVKEMTDEYYELYLNTCRERNIKPKIDKYYRIIG